MQIQGRHGHDSRCALSDELLHKPCINMQYDMERAKKQGNGDRRRGKIRRCQSCKIYMGPQLLGLSRRGRSGVELEGGEIRRQGKEEEVEVQGGGPLQPPVPLCLFDKSNRWPLTVKSLPRCRRGRACRDIAAEEEQVLWQGRGRGRGTETREGEKEKMGDLADVAARISGRSREEINTRSVRTHSETHACAFLSHNTHHQHHCCFHSVSPRPAALLPLGPLVLRSFSLLIPL